MAWACLVLAVFLSLFSGGCSNGASGEQSSSAHDGPPIQVTVSVSSDAADGQVGASGPVELPAGSTAFDALEALGVSVTTKEASLGLYVVGINGLNEKEYGGASGWTYYVNGSMPVVSANDQVLEDGDVVEWVYVV